MVEATSDAYDAKDEVENGEPLQKEVAEASSDQIKEETEKILQAGAHNGHVMNLGHGIEADTPEPHAKFFVDTVQGFRAK